MSALVTEVAADGQTIATTICRLFTPLAPRSLLHHIAQIKHLRFPPGAKDGDLKFGQERQQVQPQATWQETVEDDETRTDFKEMGKRRSPDTEVLTCWETLDLLWRWRISEYW